MCTGAEIAILGATAAGTGASLYGQSKARGEAKDANERNSKQSAWDNLISVAGGGGPMGSYREQPLPQVDIGGALSNLALAGATTYSGHQDRALRSQETKAAADREAARIKQDADQFAATLGQRQAEAAATAQYRQDALGLQGESDVMNFNQRQLEAALKPQAAPSPMSMSQAQAAYIESLPEPARSQLMRDILLRGGQNVNNTGGIDLTGGIDGVYFPGR